MSLSTEDTPLDMEDVKQYAAIKFLEQVDRPRADENSESEDSISEGGASSSDATSKSSQEAAWTRNPETQGERLGIERGKKLVMIFENTPLEDIDPAWFLLVFFDYFPNGRGLPPPGVSVLAWLKYLIRIDGSWFQSDEFICAVGDWLLRHEVNLSAWLQFKVAAADFNEAMLAEEEDVTRVATLLARRGRPKATDNRVVHALYSQVVAVAVRTMGNMFASNRFRQETFAGWEYFGIFSIFFTINKQETRSPFCWRMAGAENELWQYPNSEHPNEPPDVDLEMINRVRRHPFAQNRFYEIGITTFREVCCGFSQDGQYHQEYENGKPKGFFGALDAVMLNREQSGRIAHHAHGQMISRAVKLHGFYELMEQGAKRVIKWMASISCMVMGEYVVSLRPDGVTPFRVRPEALEGVPEGSHLTHIKMRPKRWLLSCELPSVEHVSVEAGREERTEFLVCLKTSLQIHQHSSRCVGKGAGARGDDTDCDMGFKPGPAIELEGRWDAEKRELYLPRDRTKLVACNESILLADRCNMCLTWSGDNSSRMPRTLTEDRSFKTASAKQTRYNTKYETKMDDLSGETLILNLVAAQKRTAGEETNDPRLMVVRCVNAYNK